MDDLGTAAKNEILYDIASMLWHRLSGGQTSADGPRSSEASLCSLRMHETKPFPMRREKSRLRPFFKSSSSRDVTDRFT